MRQRNSLLKLLTGARVACLAPLYAQEAQRPLTNADIINMVKSKLPESVIVQAIQSNPGHYDTSAIALVSLRKSGLTEKELNAMIATSGNGSSNTTTPTSSAGPTADASNAIPVSKSHRPKVYVLIGGSPQELPLEKTQLAETKTKPSSMKNLAADAAVTQGLQTAVNTVAMDAARHTNSAVGGSKVIASRDTQSRTMESLSGSPGPVAWIHGPASRVRKAALFDRRRPKGQNTGAK